jgi:phosphoenolpyruvate-protein phosphotransferase (PTS system enzyme I)
MTSFEATVISGSIFIGNAKIYRKYKYPVFRHDIDRTQVESELTNLRNGLKRLENEIRVFLDDEKVSQLDKDILNTHFMISSDVEINQMLQKAISVNLMSSPQAVLSTYNEIIHNFEQLDNTYFAQRADDYKDVQHRLMAILLGEGKEESFEYSSEDIIFLTEVTPSLVSSMAKSGIKAYCTEKGSQTSHSSIITRALGITAFVARDNILNTVKEGDTVILDGPGSRIIVNPGERELSDYRKIYSDLLNRDNLLKSLLSHPAVTKHNKKITVKANIEYPDEISNVLQNHCEGIGLFRTEFVYLNRSILPDENEQTQIYSQLISKFSDDTVIIRTFDLGGDKIAYLQQYKREDNPYLGCRGIRFSLQQNSLFRTQVRSILRASVNGKTGIMFPMIISVEDFLAAKNVITECMNELDAEGIAYDKNIRIGAMIETPSAALCSEQLAKVCDFFSLGTNDLVQYTLAVDRNNDKVAQYYIQYHPAVICLIKQTVQSAKQAGIPISICGEMASDLMFVPLLIGLGIEELSINPSKTAEVKMVIRNCDQELFDIIGSFDFKTDVKSIELLLKQTLKQYYTLQS